MKELVIDNIYIYIYIFQNSKYKELLEKLVQLFGTIIVELSSSVESNEEIDPIKLSIIKEFMDNKNNIIFIQYDNGYIKNDTSVLSEINTSGYIYSKFIDINNMDNIYQPIIKKIGLQYIINSNILIIPYSIKNHKYINDSLAMAKNSRQKMMIL